MKRIMLIEDNEQMQAYISEYLRAEDYDVKIIENYDCLIEELGEFEPHLILLDINLPKYDGFFFLKQIKKNFESPVMIISARSDESEQIRGLENGANDYITKPFSINILLAKINRILKVTASTTVSSYQGLQLNTSTFKLSYAEADVELTKNEMQILMLLIEAEGEYVDRDSLLDFLWDTTTFIDDNTLTVNITRVRKKLASLGLVDVIINKRGVGYALKMD